MVTRSEASMFVRKLAKYGVPVIACSFRRLKNGIEVSFRENARFDKLIIKHLKKPGRPIVARRSEFRLFCPDSCLNDEEKLKAFARELKRKLEKGG